MFPLPLMQAATIRAHWIWLPEVALKLGFKLGLNSRSSAKNKVTINRIVRSSLRSNFGFKLKLI